MDGWEELLEEIHSCLLDAIASKDVDELTKRNLKGCAENCLKLMEAIRADKGRKMPTTKLVWSLMCFIANVCSVVSVTKK